MVSGGWGGGGEWVHRILFLSTALPKQQSLAAIGFYGPLFLSSINFNLPLKMLIGFFLLSWQAMLKCINVSLKC